MGNKRQLHHFRSCSDDRLIEGNGLGSVLAATERRLGPTKVARAFHHLDLALLGKACEPARQAIAPRLPSSS